MENVVEFKRPNRMEDAELKSRFEEIRDRKRDPDWARLFAEARMRGRTQEEIAQVVGLGQQRISRLLIFADWIGWLENTPAGVNVEFRLHEVTEFKFRQFWNRHSELKGRENERRRAVLDDLIYHQREAKTHDPARWDVIVKALREHDLVNGKKYRVEAIAEKIGQPVELVREFLLCHRTGSAHGMQAEKLGEHTYKIHPAGTHKRFDAEVLRNKIQDRLEQMKALGKLHCARIFPPDLIRIAEEIEQILDEIIQPKA